MRRCPSCRCPRRWSASPRRACSPCDSMPVARRPRFRSAQGDRHDPHRASRAAAEAAAVPRALSTSARAMFSHFAEHTEGRPRASPERSPPFPRHRAVLAASAGSRPPWCAPPSPSRCSPEGRPRTCCRRRRRPPSTCALPPGDSIASAVARIRRVIRDPQVSVTVVEGTSRRPSRRPTTRSGPSSAPPCGDLPRGRHGALRADVGDRLAVLPRFSPATYRFAPLHHDAAATRAIHGVDEYVTIDSLERGERFYRHLIRSIPA